MFAFLAGRLAIIVVALVGAALAPASAQAASLSYIGPDKNAYLASPDGARTVQLTRNATADSGYQMAGQTNAGTVVVERDSVFFWLNRDGTNKSGPWVAPKGNIGTGPLKSHVAQDGGFVVFYASNCTFACQTQYFRVVFMPEGPLASECNVNCHDGYVLPRWIPGTPVAGFIDSGFNSIYVQVQNSGPQEWFGFQGADTGHFDLTRDRGRVMTEVTSETASSPGNLVLLQVNGLPPNDQVPTVLCELENFSPDGNGNPVWSPDGTQIAFQRPDGIHVSGAPTPQGSSCALPGDRLVIPGGTQPEWGPQDVPAATGGGGGGGGGGAGLAVSFGPAGRLPSLSSALRKGVAFRVRTNRAGKASVKLLASGPFARGVQVSRTRVVGRGARKLPRAGRYKVVARFTKRAKRRYRRLRKLPLTARITVKPRTGASVTKKRRFTLRRR